MEDLINKIQAELTLRKEQKGAKLLTDVQIFVIKKVLQDNE